MSAKHIHSIRSRYVPEDTPAQTNTSAQNSKQSKTVSDKALTRLLSGALAAVFVLMAIPTPRNAQNADAVSESSAVSELQRAESAFVWNNDNAAQTLADSTFSGATVRPLNTEGSVKQPQVFDLQVNRACLPKLLRTVYDSFYARALRYECYTIDLAKEAYSYEDFYRVSDAMFGDHPELWLFFSSNEAVRDETYKGNPRYIEISYQYNWRVRQSRFSPKYMDYTLKRIDRVCDRIIAKMPADQTRTEQYRYLCDALCKRTKYKDGGLFGWATAYANGPLLYGKGVCQAYAFAYQWLCHRAGLPCVLVHSYEICHTWNLVQLENGATYHVDVTWYDVCPRENFLFTQAEAEADHFPDADSFVAKEAPRA